MLNAMCESLKVLGPVHEEFHIVGIPNGCKTVESVLHLFLLVYLKVLIENICEDEKIHRVGCLECQLAMVRMNVN